MGSSKKQTVGYRYSLDMHMAVCHGPVDKLISISVDKKIAWSGQVYSTIFSQFGPFDIPIVTQTGYELPEDNTTITVNSPALFGGDDREGGLYGQIDLEFGAPDQAANSYLRSAIGASAIPAFRGIFGVILRRFYLGNNPYLKPWSFRAQRIHKSIDGETQWYDDKAAILSQQPNEPSEVLEEDFILSAVTNCASNGVFDPGVGVTLDGFSRSDVLIVDKPEGLTHQSWSIWGSDEASDGFPWQNKFNVTLDDGETTETYNQGRYATQEEAESAFTSVLLSGSTEYTFWLSDGGSSLDNRGGLSVRITRAGALIYDMNPAHIIRECLTDPDWGMGYQAADADDVSFMSSADSLYDEQMGISLLWDRQMRIEEFVNEIVRHIDATLYVDRTTGKFVLKLIRDDYSLSNLITLGEDDIERVEDYSRNAFGEFVNSVTVQYWESLSNEPGSVTVQDVALVQQQGFTVGTTIQYPGFTNSVVALRAAHRDLKSLSGSLRGCTIYATRAAASLAIGDVFILDWPDLAFEAVVMRVQGMDFGDGKSNHIRIHAVEDLFSTPDQPILSSPPVEWEELGGTARAASERVFIEAPYLKVVQSLGQTAVDETLSESPEVGYAAAAAGRPAQGNHINARLYIDSGGGYEDAASVDFSPYAYLVDAIGYGDSTIIVDGGVDLNNIAEGTIAQIGQELVRVDTVGEDSAGQTEIVIGRGVADTVPDEHAADTVVLFWDVFAAFDETEYVSGEMLSAKILTSTGTDRLALADAPEDSLTLDQRANRPYPPGNVTINGTAYPVSIGGPDELALAWSHRDRLQQTGGTIVDTTEGDIGPEANVTYTLRIYGENDTLGRTESALAVTAYNYTDELEDFQLDSGDSGIVEGIDDITDLLAYWSMSDGAGTTLTDDHASFHGTLTSDVIWTASGVISSALQADGTNRVDLGSASNLLSIADIFTVWCWVFINDASDGVQILDLGFQASAGVDSDNNGLAFTISNQSPRFRVVQGTGGGGYGGDNRGFWLTTIDLKVGAWNLVIMDRTTTDARCYIYNDDGSQSETVSLGGSFSLSNWTNRKNHILARTANPGDDSYAQTASGVLIDELGVMARLLTKQERDSLYNSGSGLPYPFEDQADSNSTYRLNGRLRFELESVRDQNQSNPITSYQYHNVTVLREGYGFNYGLLYGGGA